MENYQHSSLEQHLKDERLAYANLALLNIQTSALLERFYREWLTLDSKRQVILNELEYHSRAIRDHRRRIELNLFPTELKPWVLSVIPDLLIEKKEENIDINYEPFNDIICSTLPTTGKSRMMFEDIILRQVVRFSEGDSIKEKEKSAPSRLIRVAPQPELLLNLSFLPYKNIETNTWHRRPILGDLVVMRSPEPSMGRVLVSMHTIPRGETIMIENAFFFCYPIKNREEFDDKLLPPVIREAMMLVYRQSSIFKVRGWDIRLLRPFYYWLTEIIFNDNNHNFMQRWNELSCPMEDIDPSYLTKLSDLAHFLWLSLPSSLSLYIGNEEKIIMFFVSFLTNAINYGGISVIDDIFSTKTNEVNLGNIEKGMAIFGSFSLIEHSCHPNAVVIFRYSCNLDSILFAELRATRPIAMGERITISYVPIFLPKEERDKRLRARYFFSCACEHCINGIDTTRLMFLSKESYKSQIMLCPKGKGSEWISLSLSSLSSSKSIENKEEVKKLYRYDDFHVLNSIREEVKFRQETDAVDFSEGDNFLNVISKEVARLQEVLNGDGEILISPFHYIFLLRTLRLSAFVLSDNSYYLDNNKKYLIWSFLNNLLNKITPVIFILPDWFITELLLGNIKQGVLSDDLRNRLLNNNNNNNNNNNEINRQPWQENFKLNPLFEQHGTLVVSLWEYYASLSEGIKENNNEENVINAWTACVLLIRYGLCQHGSERCLNAQLKALQYRQQNQKTEVITENK